MAASNTGYHEGVDLRKPQTLDRHRGIVPPLEEREAIDWRDQPIDATPNEEFAATLAQWR